MISEHAKTYDDMLEVFRVATRKFAAAQKAYRERMIGDSEFLVARAEWKAADEAMDIAERVYIDKCNETLQQ